VPAVFLAAGLILSDVWLGREQIGKAGFSENCQKPAKSDRSEFKNH
jgi:hypothetical protein